MIDDPPIATGHDHLGPDLVEVEDHQPDFLPDLKFGDVLVEVGAQIRGANDSFGSLVKRHIHDVFLSRLERVFLQTEGDEEIFFESPVREGTVGRDVDDVHERKLADRRQGALGGGDGPVLRIGVDEYAQLVPERESVWGPLARQQNGVLFGA